MKTELTEQQINELFTFCKKHYVQYYDVQIELVDHLANAIEDKMNEDKNISFDNALHKVYKSFGITGFSKIVAAKEKAVGKQCQKLRWKLYGSYFTPPKLALTVCIFISFFVMKKIIFKDYLLYGLFTLSILLLVFEITQSVKSRKLFKKNTKPLLMVQLYPQMFFSFLFFNVFAQVKLLYKTLAYDAYYAIFAVVLTLCFVGVLSYKNYYTKLFNLAQTQYPQAFAG